VTNNLTTTATFNNSAGTVDLNGRNLSAADLQGSASITNNGAATTLTVTNTGNYSGVISNGSGAIALTKQGAGTLTLSGSNTYSGLTTVSAGVIDVQNNAGLGTT